jgi:hypothetical protein
MQNLKFLSVVLWFVIAPWLLTSCTKDHSGKDRITENVEDEFVLSAHNNSGLVLSNFPSMEDPGPPFYARFGDIAPYIYYDGNYAVIIFYREPSLIPAEFNLLTFFDPPAAFSVPLTVWGKLLWHGQIGSGAPKVAHIEGSSVPVWFVPVSPLEQLIQQQNSLTISDLQTIDGILKGTADKFKEIAHPHPLPEAFGGGGHPQPKLNIIAQGTLDGGGEFMVNLSAQQKGDEWLRTTRIKFM